MLGGGDWRIGRWFVGWASLAACLALPSATVAEDYDELPVTAELKRESYKIGQMLLDGKILPASQAEFEDYYQKYALARWTLQKEAASIPGFRQDLRNNLRRARTGQAHDQLNALALDFLNKMAEGNHTPAARLNAMLMIGELNSAEQSGSDAAVPLAEALNVLVAAAENAKLPDYVRSAAMVGIVRHAAVGIRNEDAKKKVATAMLKAASTDLPTDGTRPGREWIVAQAAEALGLLGSVGDGNAAFKALVGIVGDAKLAPRTRAIAATALGQLNLTGASGINPADAAAALGGFALDACRDELQRVEEKTSPFSRRRARTCLTAVAAGLSGGVESQGKGVAALAREGAVKAYVDDLVANVKAMSGVIDDEKKKDSEVMASATQFRGKLEAWLKKKPK